MRNDVICLALICIGLVAPARGRAEDLGMEASSQFKRRAAAISEIRTLELERKASELRQAVSGKPSLAGGPLDEGQVAASPVVLYEIGGSGDRLTATFRMADGQLREFVPDQTVKGFGRIKAIWPQAVEDDKGRFHSVSPLPEAIR